MRIYGEMMRFYYRCSICKCGFWQDSPFSSHNIECLHCGADSHEELFDENYGKMVSKLQRIQVAPNAKGEIELPSYSFECGKCGHQFGIFAYYSKKAKTKCPQCKAGYHQFNEIYGVPQVISDLSHTEGRTGHEDLDMSHVFGEGARVSSRRQLGEYKKITRDRYFENTNKARAVIRPVRDPGTGQITLEKVNSTPAGQGVDLGEIHEVDDSTVNRDVEKNAEKEWAELEKVAAAQVNPTADDIAKVER